ncbi:monovalent cation:proton antiporter-2 (CPA2) family protein [Parasphingorhabdus sp.]|uniref:monovalent cation:proton antiporter-2 (CPA2) family protein n=1 Tax=Parasphingorhabdus sp. TaxID=2709688 RepID=UPI002F948082
MEGTETHLGDLLLGGFTMLGASLILVLLFRRFGIGAVLGYLIAGILIGPQGLGLIREGANILEFSEIGIILLLFLVGLELAPSRLMRLRQAIFGLGMGQVILCGLALFLLILATTNFSVGAALAIGLPLALSSTAQVLPMLRSSGRLNTPAGEKAFSILLFQDLSIIPLLTIVAVLSRAPADEGALPGWQVAVFGILAIGGLILAGKYLLQPVLALVGKVAERELFIVAGLVVVFGSAALMEIIGLSPALGAFIAGVMLANSPYRHELEADIDPFRSLLLGLFFLAVGMMLDIAIIAENTAFVFSAAIALVVVKIVIITGLGKLFGMATRPALVMGMLLSQGGEFGFVLFGAAEKGLLIEPQASSLFSAVITISMATTPLLMLIVNRFNVTGPAGDEDLDDVKNANPASVIVVGHGRFGQTVAQMLSGANVPVTMIDNKPHQIGVSRKHGRKVFYGDGTRVDLLRGAGADKCSAIVFCMEGAKLKAETLEFIGMNFPHLKLYVRAYDRIHLLEVKKAGIAGAKRDVFESAIHLARQTLTGLDIDDTLIDDVEREYRKLDCDRLEVQRTAGDVFAGRHLAFGVTETDKDEE